MPASFLVSKHPCGLDVPGLACPAKRRTEFFQRLERLCPVCALQVRLMEAFGLSVPEVVDLEPVKADAGDRLVIQQREGFRFVRIESAQQRSLLDAAKAAVDSRGLMRAAAGRDSRQACRRLRYFVAAAAAQRPHDAAHERPANHRATAPAVLFTQHRLDLGDVSRSALL